MKKKDRIHIRTTAYKKERIKEYCKQNETKISVLIKQCIAQSVGNIKEKRRSPTRIIDIGIKKEEFTAYLSVRERKGLKRYCLAHKISASVVIDEFLSEVLSEFLKR